MKMAPLKIYVGNMPPHARNSELKELFEKFGKVVECDILKEFGFVHMDDISDAKAAIAGLNDTLWKGSRIRVEISTTKTQKGEPSERKLR
jgi:RNA-binding protein 4